MEIAGHPRRNMADAQEVAMMLTYDYINKEWIASPTARRIYRISAGLSLALIVFWWVSLVGGIPAQLRPIVQLLVFVGILGAATTLVGMQYFLFRFDDSHPLVQMFWFVILLLPLLGPPLYCFISTALSFTRAQRSSSKHARSRHQICRDDIADCSVRLNRTFAVEVKIIQANAKATTSSAGWCDWQRRATFRFQKSRYL
jgi:hypothetical protein